MAKKFYQDTPKRNSGFWGDALGAAIKEMEANDPKFKEERQASKEEEIRKRAKLKKLLPILYIFLSGYKFDSGILINNLYRGRDWKTYEADMWDEFTMDFFHGPNPMVFGKDVRAHALSWNWVKVLGYRHQQRIAYYPIDKFMIQLLEALADAIELSPKLSVATPLYRGCTNDRNGVSGIVSTTTSREIALQFSRGDLLQIAFEEGMTGLNIGASRPKGQRKDVENEILLPPCSYVEDFTKRKVVKKGSLGDEPNNFHPTTNVRYITVQPLDLLEEAYRVLKNPPAEYMEFVYPTQKIGEFERAVDYLAERIDKRATGHRWNYPIKLG